MEKAERDPRTYAVIGAGMDVFNEMGSGFHEPIYHECLEVEFQRRNVPAVHEPPIQVHYKDVLLKKEYNPDFICFGDVVVEVKVLDRLTSKEEAQLLSYLKATKLHVGLLINFGGDEFQWKRMVL
jgi:GxxExxY protein